MRIYVPANSLMLERWVLDGSMRVSDACAVTPALREWYSGDDEELEYLATAAAARLSLEMLDSALPRRVVIAAEHDGPFQMHHGGHRAAISIDAAIPARAIAAALVDGAEAEDDVKRALAALPSALTDDDARFAIDQVEGHELLWFAAQELPFIF